MFYIMRRLNLPRVKMSIPRDTAKVSALLLPCPPVTFHLFMFPVSPASIQTYCFVVCSHCFCIEFDISQSTRIDVTGDIGATELEDDG